jgi:hypothetical protein
MRRRELITLLSGATAARGRFRLQRKSYPGTSAGARVNAELRSELAEARTRAATGEPVLRRLQAH